MSYQPRSPSISEHMRRILHPVRRPVLSAPVLRERCECVPLGMLTFPFHPPIFLSNRSQHGVGVSPDPALARQYYLRSSSAPAVLGLWLMGLSDFVTEVAGPLALSMVIVGFTMVAFRLRKRMRRRRSRNGVGRGLRSLNVGHVGPDGREGEGRGDGRADSARR